jgi:hypothetical protein
LGLDLPFLYFLIIKKIKILLKYIFICFENIYFIKFFLFLIIKKTRMEEQDPNKENIEGGEPNPEGEDAQNVEQEEDNNEGEGIEGLMENESKGGEGEDEAEGEGRR